MKWCREHSLVLRLPPLGCHGFQVHYEWTVYEFKNDAEQPVVAVKRVVFAAAPPCVDVFENAQKVGFCGVAVVRFATEVGESVTKAANGVVVFHHHVAFSKHQPKTCWVVKCLMFQVIPDLVTGSRGTDTKKTIHLQHEPVCPVVLSRQGSAAWIKGVKLQNTFF